MLGYHVFFHVQNSKKSYNSTEFYENECDAKKRAFELSAACNVTLITVRTVSVNSLDLEVVKGHLEV